MRPQQIDPVEPAAAYRLVADSIRRSIQLGAYIAGEKLPPERVLSQQLNVSRTTLREAIRALEAEGYVASRRGATGGVTVLGRRRTPPELRQLLRERSAEFEEAIDFRLAVECAAARLAAERRTRAELAQLKSALALADAEQPPAVFIRHDTAFHLGIADAAHNAMLRRAIEEARAAIWVPVVELAHHILPTASASEGLLMTRHHLEMFEGIRDRDADRAEAATAAHIENARTQIAAVLKGS